MAAPLLFAAAEAAAHPLAGTIADWIWLVLVLPLAGAALNGGLAAFSRWKPGPYDPDRHHWGHGNVGLTGEHLVGVFDTQLWRAAAAGTGEFPLPGAGDTAHAADDSAADEGAADDGGADPDRPLPNPVMPVVTAVAVGVMVAAFGLAAAICAAMAGAHADAPYVRTFFPWVTAGGLTLGATLHLDQLAMLMTLVVTGVGTLIHVFSVGYMRNDSAYARYFAYLNLFVFFMLLLVLGGSYPLLFVGWEGVGLCSYLLIGFWFGDRRNADAGRKAFIVNRIGDFGVLLAMFLMWVHFGALDFVGVSAAVAGVPVGGAVATTIALCLFLGCTGKSAQLPLYVWLPDAMAGPTPVSALIHAATMVTAGVYLVARSAALFAAAPAASLVVTVVGAATALFAATIGLKQWDIKKVLAYSTISQLGYMFVGVGVGAYAAGLFHVVTHAFFKALLFLGAGSVIHAMHHALHATHAPADAQDMRNMGGLRAALPVTAVLMWIATLAIAGIPPLSGFFSKDEILAAAFARAQAGPLAEATLLGVAGRVWIAGAWAVCLVAAFLTAVYMTRMMRYTFHGPSRVAADAQAHLHEPGWVMTGPLVVLGVATVVAGWLNLPAVVTDTLPIGPTGVLHHWLDPVVGTAEQALRGAVHLSAAIEWGLIGFAVLVALAGIATAWRVCRPEALVPADQAEPETGWLARALANKWYVDEVYARVLVRPMEAVARTVLWRGIDQGLIDGVLVNGLGWKVPSVLGRLGAALHSGRTGTYAWVLVLGAVAVLTAFSVR